MVTIAYCSACRYLPRATRVQAVLQERLGVAAELSEGSTGAFEVRVRDEVVAKKTLDGFPNEDEIVAAVAARLGPQVP